MTGAGSAVVVGAGVGGLCAAARLAGAGWQVTVVERLRHVGGRWSTREVEGFKLPTGAFLIAMDDPLADTFTDLGIDFPVRAIEERTAYLIGGQVVGTGDRGGLRALVSAAADQDGSDAHAVMAAVRGALGGDVPAGEDPLPEWLANRGAGAAVIDAIHSLVQAFMGVNASEVSARAFFDYLVATAGRGRHGIPPEGSLRLAQNLADFVVARGGEVRLGAGVTELVVEGDRVVGVRTRAGDELRADVVVSDVGVDATRELLPGGPAAALPGKGEVASAPGITCFIALQEPYFDVPALVVTGTRCVCLVTTPTLVAPELAPEGWHYMETISTFTSSTDDSDPKGEMQRHLADVDDILPGWRERGRLLQTATYRSSWPVYRAWPGTDPQERFPVPGLALVGDSVKPHGWPGTGASAESARLVVDEILEEA
ncbi:MAG: phytoene desaturase family protein [Acidimicrobiia bacterium]